MIPYKISCFRVSSEILLLSLIEAVHWTLSARSYQLIWAISPVPQLVTPPTTISCKIGSRVKNVSKFADPPSRESTLAFYSSVRRQLINLIHSLPSLASVRCWYYLDDGPGQGVRKRQIVRFILLFPSSQSFPPRLLGGTVSLAGPQLSMNWSAIYQPSYCWLLLLLTRHSLSSGAGTVYWWPQHVGGMLSEGAFDGLLLHRSI